MKPQCRHCLFGTLWCTEKKQKTNQIWNQHALIVNNGKIQLKQCLHMNLRSCSVSPDDLHATLRTRKGKRCGILAAIYPFGGVVICVQPGPDKCHSLYLEATSAVNQSTATARCASKLRWVCLPIFVASTPKCVLRLLSTFRYVPTILSTSTQYVSYFVHTGVCAKSRVRDASVIEACIQNWHYLLTILSKRVWSLLNKY